MNKNNTKYLIKTKNGFKSFSGISCKEKESFLIKLESKNEIECSQDHPFIVNGITIRANELNIGDYLECSNGLQKIISIKDIGKKPCYDLLNVKDTHSYYANDILVHNSFLGSSDTLISGKRIGELKDAFKAIESHKFQLHKDFKKTTIDLYHPPEQGRAYIIGADPSMGGGNDYQAMTVWDITNTFDIKLVASFYENDIQPKMFAYILTKTAILFNNAFIAMENNGVSQVTLTSLWQDYEYENIISEGGNVKTSIGIHSSGTRKIDACVNFRSIVEDNRRKIEIGDGRIIDEMERFERRSKIGKIPQYEAAGGHDDLMMCSIWAFYVLKMEILDNYYDVKRTIVDTLGNELPMIVFSSEDSESLSQTRKMIAELDEKMSNSIGQYQKDLRTLEEEIKASQENLMNQFLRESGQETEEAANEQNDSDFHFDGFIG